MITIEVYRRPDKVNDEELVRITKELLLLVSKALCLETTETERARVLVYDFGSFDMNTEDLDISIRTRNYPATIHERKEVIAKGIEEIINKIIAARKGLPSFITCEVELNLVPSSYRAIQSSK